ncbi:hypothetical protein [uncultured Roseobacter sp.]|uniref:hypothetical protein n=1 Tax=uncultured Roseobacter sp. TaxID=114847 RepID=UPI00260BE6A5|nr:hypothetical protein [uncultured Roseobacter sp.]
MSLPMLSSKTTSLVAFVLPFVVTGSSDDLPPSSCEFFEEDEFTQSLRMLAERKTLTKLLIRRVTGGCRLRFNDHRDLEMALTRSRAGQKQTKQ